MSGTLAHVGTVTVGGAIPLALTAQAELDATLGVSLPEIQAKIDALVALSASLTITPPTLAASLVAALDTVAGLQAAIAAGVPSAALDLSAVAAALADLQAYLGTLTASAAFSASLAAYFGQAGVSVYRYDGTLTQLPGAAAGVVSGSTPGVGVFLFATAGGTTAALEAVFGV
jgi:hypothetical protein